MGDANVTKGGWVLRRLMNGPWCLVKVQPGVPCLSTDESASRAEAVRRLRDLREVQLEQARRQVDDLGAEVGELSRWIDELEQKERENAGG